MHEDQLSISVEQVRALITDQAPQWASRPVRVVRTDGTVNSIFRIGDDLAARFPLQSDDHPEARSRLAAQGAAMAEFHRASPFPSPELALVGEPGHGYPAAWTVQTWVEGVTPTATSLQDSAVFAVDLAVLVSSLRRWPTNGRVFDGANRGGDLRDHDAWMEKCIARSDGLVDTKAMRRLWTRFRDLPREDPDAMSHTDLIPGNLLVDGDRLVGVVDSGDFRAADPALDLVVAWHLLGDSARSIFRERLPDDDLRWERGRAWALEQAAGLVWYYHRSNPAMAGLGRTTIERLTSAA